VFGLSDKQLEQTGVVLERTKKSMDNFRELFKRAAELILGLLKHEGH
jgi:hypothetical protein